MQLSSHAHSSPVPFRTTKHQPLPPKKKRMIKETKKKEKSDKKNPGLNGDCRYLKDMKEEAKHMLL